ncbi:MAG: hypothetical protein MZV49_25175 [Rhodopseudomonas palustris]|nr:hypothetical protein [Rhodopseudomonas palustris]
MDRDLGDADEQRVSARRPVRGFPPHQRLTPGRRKGCSSTMRRGPRSGRRSSTAVARRAAALPPGRDGAEYTDSSWSVLSHWYIRCTGM